MASYQFRPGWAATLAVAVLLPLFASLGVWQLHRADEKTLLMRQREQRQAEPVLRADSPGWASAENRYRRVELKGDWDSQHQILLDNQIYKQQAGYQVLTPLRIEGSSDAVLVNRGWIPVGVDRHRLPEIGLLEKTAHIEGVLDLFPGVGFKLKGAEIPTQGWPAVAQLLDAAVLSDRLGYRLLPYQVLLAPDAPAGYARDWKQASLNPEKNQGYALQWFGFALALSVLYLWYGVKRKPPD
jgi:surfeit locus 1 family protein